MFFVRVQTGRRDRRCFTGHRGNYFLVWPAIVLVYLHGNLLCWIMRLRAGFDHILPDARRHDNRSIVYYEAQRGHYPKKSS